MESEIKKLYYSISEVSKIIGLKQYVLRYWQTEFPTLSPKKNRAGNRIYRQKDIDEVLKIKSLLYDQGYTIKGARQQILVDQQSGETEDQESVLNSKDELRYKNLLTSIKEELQSILDILKTG